ncbi:MAG: dTDP-4-amino-4,6-dideoxygalactose transaminase [Chitinispirillales bacterium]|jgi:dTDP-4-amino-4,6-dideoxygalactose transaminase|nr:dTDP-4-amino-4,6-dideoxygalactose transaminase [Chitinispirillales bacterium]
MSITFNKPPVSPNSEAYIKCALTQKVGGDGEFTKKCSSLLEEMTGAAKVLLTTSCSHALDMTAYLCGVEAGDEVIMASYTFPSMANAFVGRGAKIVFVDICPDTMNIDGNLIEAAISGKTRGIVPMHYAGVACDMDKINDIAARHGLFVVEDAAQGVMADYKGRALGAIGDYGCVSFHETKNFSMGEGGALFIRDAEKVLDAEIVREKGTNRSSFFRGEIDKYSWVGWGSSFLPSEINAAYLWSQLEIASEINAARIGVWDMYYEMLGPLAKEGFIKLPYIPRECRHNAHIFYIKVADGKVQAALLGYLKERGIGAAFHYVPLHTSEAGRKFGIFHGEDRFTTKESSRLIRLPIYHGLSEAEVEAVVRAVGSYFKR